MHEPTEEELADGSALEKALTLTSAKDELTAKIEQLEREQRLEKIRAGSVLTKYNQRDGKSSLRWVKLTGSKLAWGDVKTRRCHSTLDLSNATALVHGGKGSAFYKAHAKGHQDWQCLSVVTKGRTLDLACESVEQLFDWYLALASLMPNSTEPLMDEAALRSRIEHE